jgi:hypothetical protein
MTSLQRRLVAFFVALAISAFAGSALAQTAAAPAAQPKHGCTSPGDHPGKLASDNQRRNWTKAMTTYLECLKKYIADQKAAAEPYLNASNAAIDEYNNSAKLFNAQIQQAAE